MVRQKEQAVVVDDSIDEILGLIRNLPHTESLSCRRKCVRSIVPNFLAVHLNNCLKSVKWFPVQSLEAHIRKDHHGNDIHCVPPEFHNVLLLIEILG